MKGEQDMLLPGRGRGWLRPKVGDPFRGNYGSYNWWFR